MRGLAFKIDVEGGRGRKMNNDVYYQAYQCLIRFKNNNGNISALEKQIGSPNGTIQKFLKEERELAEKWHQPIIDFLTRAQTPSEVAAKRLIAAANKPKQAVLEPSVDIPHAKELPAPTIASFDQEKPVVVSQTHEEYCTEFALKLFKAVGYNKPMFTRIMLREIEKLKSTDVQMEEKKGKTDAPVARVAWKINQK